MSILNTFFKENNKIFGKIQNFQKFLIHLRMNSKILENRNLLIYLIKCFKLIPKKELQFNKSFNTLGFQTKVIKQVVLLFEILTKLFYSK